MQKVKGTLNGLDGNTFALLGYFQKEAIRQSFSKTWIRSILDEAKCKDYRHPLNTLPDNMEE